MDRATGGAVAERNAAIHAAGRLLCEIMLVERQRELAEMPDSIGGELVLLLLPVELEEACDLAHRSVQSRHFVSRRTIPPQEGERLGRDRIQFSSVGVLIRANPLVLTVPGTLASARARFAKFSRTEAARIYASRSLTRSATDPPGDPNGIA
jgi:hypothetical protein